MTAAAYKASKPKRNKYRAVKTIVDGITFDSKGEAGRYAVLRRMEQAGEISNLQLQVKFPLIVNDAQICVYRSDFVYHVPGKEGQIVEDFKGFRTPEYKLKAKLFRAIFGYSIYETGTRK